MKEAAQRVASLSLLVDDCCLSKSQWHAIPVYRCITGMATSAQILKLRRKIQDYYSARTGEVLTTGEQAFKDDELEDIIDDAAAESTDGGSTAADLTPKDEALTMILARADAMLQIAQDEARRVKWQTGNEIQDPSKVAENLVMVAEALRRRYKDARDRALREEIAGVGSRPTGKNMHFNDTVKRNYERNFDNGTVKRNRSRDHLY